ncbi:hypothetical protein [Motiliproteus sediminis]|uniref:hypothetical protein n=1 Tax=Motiliproteus sediminis TaxID=1468178 RepID=UPI001AEFF5F8|nr:hypothetical protein [Motiliproteus sediminis]
MNRNTLLLLGCITLSACAHNSPSPVLAGGCSAVDFGVFNQCLKTLPQTELGLADPTNRKQYLLYAEKLDQDRRLQGLTDAAAFASLAARRELLNNDPAASSQCARFAERILCY